MALDAVGANAKYYCVSFLKLRIGIAEAASLDLSATGEVLRIEVEDNFSALEVGKLHQATLLILQCEVGRIFSNRRHFIPPVSGCRQHSGCDDCTTYASG